MLGKFKKLIQKEKYRRTDNDFRLLNDPIQKKGEEIFEKNFPGGPIKTFGKVGRLQLMSLLRIGLLPSSKLLDIGCGALRGGYWIIHFLNKGNYYGIEPNKEMLQLGLDTLLGEKERALKEPSFDHNYDFDFSIFGQKFDFFVARSIWTHTSKKQMTDMLDGFVQNGNPGASFLTSYLRSNSEHPPYEGDEWIGISHESKDAGLAFHDFDWIKAECSKRNLSVEELPFDVFKRQIWLLIRQQ